MDGELGLRQRLMQHITDSPVRLASGVHRDKTNSRRDRPRPGRIPDGTLRGLGSGELSVFARPSGPRTSEDDV
jgi:hypothetical protein